MRSRRLFRVGLVVAALGGLGAVSVAGAQSAPRLQPAANPEVSYLVSLNGANEVPGPGDPDATGQAAITVNGSTGLVCINLTTTLSEPIISMHIHPGALGVAGAPVVDFAVTSGTSVAKCVTTTPAQASTIVASPTNFYFNAHTASFPAGAIRGQLALRGNGAGELRLLDEPLRAFDSRAGGIKLVAGTSKTIDLSSGTDGAGVVAPAVPAGARAALVTVTVTQTVGGGYLTAYSNALTAVPATSTVNWTASNSDVAATTTVAVDGSGKIALFDGQNGTHVIVDVIGYYL